jgi:thiamine-phosphate pyrophosphorylase
MKREVFRVYPIVDLNWRVASPLGEARRVVGAVLRGGATLIQVREKTDRFDQVAQLITVVRPWLEQAGVPLIINDRLDLALALGADGVHVGQHDVPVSEVRRVAAAWGRSHLWVGVSVTTAEQARRAVREGATYLSASPVFGTVTKANLDPPVGIAGLRQLREAAREVPLVAIGGIRRENVAAVLAAGADGVSFISPLRGDPEGAVREMVDAVSFGAQEARLANSAVPSSG